MSDEINLKWGFTPKHIKHRKKHNQNPMMKNITINYPILYDNQIWELKRKGIVPSRSEAVRIAIREFLYKEMKFLKRLEEE